MPVYVFRCEGCGHEFSLLTSWSKKAEATCPECGGSQLVEQFGQYRFAAGGGTSSGSAAGGPACAPGAA